MSQLHPVPEQYPTVLTKVGILIADHFNGIEMEELMRLRQTTLRAMAYLGDRDQQAVFAAGSDQMAAARQITESYFRRVGVDQTAVQNVHFSHYERRLKQLAAELQLTQEQLVAISRVDEASYQTYIDEPAAQEWAGLLSDQEEDDSERSDVRLQEALQAWMVIRMHAFWSSASVVFLSALSRELVGYAVPNGQEIEDLDHLRDIIAPIFGRFEPSEPALNDINLGRVQLMMQDAQADMRLLSCMLTDNDIHKLQGELRDYELLDEETARSLHELSGRNDRRRFAGPEYFAEFSQEVARSLKTLTAKLPTT